MPPARPPAGVHFRPEGGPGAQTLLILWTYDVRPTPAVWPTRFEPEYAEVVVRGLSRMIPGLAAYAGNVGRPYVDGGYYCKTQENRPLIGRLTISKETGDKAVNFILLKDPEGVQTSLQVVDLVRV